MAYSQYIQAMIFTKPPWATQHFKWHITEAESCDSKPIFISACRAPATVLNLRVIFFSNDVCQQCDFVFANQNSLFWLIVSSVEGKNNQLREALWPQCLCGGGRMAEHIPSYTLWRGAGLRLDLAASPDSQELSTPLTHLCHSLKPPTRDPQLGLGAHNTHLTHLLLSPWFGWCFLCRMSLNNQTL